MITHFSNIEFKLMHQVMFHHACSDDVIYLVQEGLLNLMQSVRSEFKVLLSSIAVTKLCRHAFFLFYVIYLFILVVINLFCHRCDQTQTVNKLLLPKLKGRQ